MKVRDSTILSSLFGLYIALLLVANVTAGKLFDFYGLMISTGFLPYILCTDLSDLILDVYGKGMALKLIGVGIVVNVMAVGFYAFTLYLPTPPFQSELQAAMQTVFLSSTSVILGSLCSYPFTELVDTYIWVLVKKITKKRFLFIRNFVNSFLGQVFDAFIFFSLAFFVFPTILTGSPIIPFEFYMPVIFGALCYGAFKGLLSGTLDYGLLLVLRNLIDKIRIADIPELVPITEKEKVVGKF
jgi:hypothetical protein